MPVSIDKNDDKRIYYYEWVITGNANWTAVINPPRILTVNCGEHGTVTSADDTYANGDTVTLTVTADPGYYVKSTELNGAAVSLNSDNEYVFTIESDSTFTAEFAEIPPDSYVVTVNCGEHGAVTPGTADYESGTEVTLTVTPDSGYRVKSVTLDGKAVTLTNGKYTFKVTANCTFEAEFVKKGGSSGGTGGSGGSSGGSAGGSSTRSLPVINGIEKSWQSIVSDISRLPEGGSAVIALNGETVVPVEVVRAISDVKAKVEFVVSTAKSWMIDGAKITTVCAADFTALPGVADKTSLRGVNGAAFKGGDTGVPAVLKLTFRKEFAGQFANVYKLADNRLVFLQCVKITADGTALISGVNAAGEYAVMVCEYSDLIGDINNDGVLNALDASAILRHITGIFEGVDILFADFNNDGTVNALDASAILKAIIE